MSEPGKSILYDAAIGAASVVKSIASGFNKKLALREKSIRPALESLSRLPEKNKRVWFHAASMGEFEQAAPIMDYLKSGDENLQIVASFFSPSGYENRKNYESLDAALYMPFDLASAAREFVGMIDPDFAVFVRYEIWRNHLLALKNSGVPSALACATAPNSGILTGPLKSFTRNNYNLFDIIFAINSEQTEFFKKLKTQSEVKTLGDARIDRILDKVERSRENKALPDDVFESDDFVLVAGSCWPPDEDLIIEASNGLVEDLRRKLKIIFCPHEPTREHVARLASKLERSVLLSEFEPKTYDGRSIIVDSIGILLRLYANADAAFVGGAFGAGVHSVAEPAGYGIPLFCGPKYGRSPDAEALIRLNGLTSVEKSADLKEKLEEIIGDENKRKAIGRINEDYMKAGAGAAKVIAEYILARIRS